MRKKERNYEVKINGIPQLKDMPKDLLLFPFHTGKGYRGDRAGRHTDNGAKNCVG